MEKSQRIFLSSVCLVWFGVLGIFGIGFFVCWFGLVVFGFFFGRGEISVFWVFFKEAKHIEVGSCHHFCSLCLRKPSFVDFCQV